MAQNWFVALSEVQLFKMYVLEENERRFALFADIRIFENDISAAVRQL